MKKKVGYTDGFVLLVPKNKTAEYKKMAAGAAKVWMKYGALGYKECMGNDLNPDMGGMGTLALTFPKMTKAKPDETVWFSYIEYKSRAHRDAVNKKVMAEMKKSNDDCKDMEMPFDMKRMAYGGFEVMVSN